MTTQEQTLSVTEVANRFYYLAEQGNFDQILDELYSEEAKSLEPENSFLKSVEGLEQIRAKGKSWNEMTEEVHSSFTHQPIVAGDYFACAMGMDVTVKDHGRIPMNEIAVYKVESGKIVSEQFFY